jgi:cell division protease FtsH
MGNNQNKHYQQPSGPRGLKKPQLPSSYRQNPLTLLVIAALIFTIYMAVRPMLSRQEIRYDQFIEYVQSGYVTKVTVKEAEITGTFNEKGLSTLPKGSKEEFVVYYKPDVGGDKLAQLLLDNKVQTEFEMPKTFLYSLIATMLPLVILIGIFYFLFIRNMRGGAGGMLMSFGRSKHRMQTKEKVNVTFEDVAGIDEAKEEVAEIIEFLKNPKKFQRLGGRIPRGVLLIGPPGCGKTLLAKAIAGQADVPFLSISGSDFVEMFVGVGASRVRDLFKQAKDNSPCIIFLDEIDAIGRRRGASIIGGGHDEREQTLNAILVEMDGFDTNDQVIVIAATNRSDILDNALTRPGRFDRQVIVPLPDLKGRLEILAVHAKKVKLGPDANLEKLARGTPMFSGADLAAIINEAALLATMEEKEYVEMSDLEESRDKVRWGRAKKSRVIDQKEKEITAYHEAGHTLVQSLLKDADPLHKVSIIPRGPMGGATFALPEKDRTIFTRRYCLALLQVCFAGRIAEELFCDDISSGAQMDIQRATEIAKQMVLVWGMSDKLGLINYGPEMGQPEMVYVMPGEKTYSENTAQQIDEEIKRITKQTYEDAKKLIEENKDKLERVAKALLKYETLDAADVKIILQGGDIRKPTVTDLLAAEQKKTEDKKTGSEGGNKQEN